MEEIALKSDAIDLVSLNEIKLNPKNRNSHSDEQIDRLCEIIKYQGFRAPLIISNRSGLLVAGHGRYLAAEKLGMTEVPVMYQDFDSEEQEYLAMVSDNAIASWSELDFKGIHADIGELGPFDLELLGLKDFSMDLPETEEQEAPELKEKKMANCPECGHTFLP